MEPEDKIKRAIDRTRVIRSPRQNVATFGSSNVYYYLVTELADQINMVREGRVIAERPQIVTPMYLLHLEGFTDGGREFLARIAHDFPNEPGLFYRYKNEARQQNVVSGSLEAVVQRISDDIDRQNEPSSAIVKGSEDLWDVSLLKFIFELTSSSLHRNVSELQSSGMLRMDRAGVPRQARDHIEELFEKARGNPAYASELIAELRRWDLFEEYQDRFLALFHKT